VPNPMRPAASLREGPVQDPDDDSLACAAAAGRTGGLSASAPDLCSIVERF
jgi:hypothetical protein